MRIRSNCKPAESAKLLIITIRESPRNATIKTQGLHDGPLSLPVCSLDYKEQEINIPVLCISRILGPYFYQVPFAVIILASILSPPRQQTKAHLRGIWGTAVQTSRNASRLAARRSVGAKHSFSHQSHLIWACTLYGREWSQYICGWRVASSGRVGGEATLMCFPLTGWKERGPPGGQSTSALLKLASLLIYWCLNWA